jgi:hypothetical protein
VHILKLLKREKYNSAMKKIHYKTLKWSQF